MKQSIVTLDLEGVLVPEIWINVAERTGIAELRRTTRDEPDYDKLMRGRIAILERHELGLPDIQGVIEQMHGQPEVLIRCAVTIAGSEIAVDYTGSGPSLSVRLQEVFGLMDSPRVVEGRVPVTLELLSPADRPVQITRDLPGFWAGSWADVRKEMAGRYPKHQWPTDPANAGCVCSRTEIQCFSGSTATVPPSLPRAASTA